MNTHPMNSPITPLSYVLVTLWTLPHSTAMLNTINPLSVVDFTIRPSEASLPLPYTINIQPVICGSIRITHEPPSLLLVRPELPFIDLRILVDYDSCNTMHYNRSLLTISLSIAILDLTVIGTLLEELNLHILLGHQIL